MPVAFKDVNCREEEFFANHETVRRIELGDTIAFIAVHNTKLGPSLGGCRMRPYPDEDAAIQDVLRLSQGMTYKNALADLPLGGGKAVIIGDPKATKTSELMNAMGEAVESLEGRYITAEDSGTGEEDMVAMHESTQYVTGLPHEAESLGGNPSPVTAWGLYHALQSAAKFRYGSPDLIGLKVAIQGIGAVGYPLAELLYKDSVELVVCDTDQNALQKAEKDFPGIEIVDLDSIYKQGVQIFAPCAMGAVLNDDTIPQLQCDVVVGAANNQLHRAHHDEQLAQKDILYVPDFVANAGGVVCVSYEYFQASGYNPRHFTLTRSAMMEHVAHIGDTVTGILEHAKENSITPGQAANRRAEGLFNNDMAA